MTVTCSRRRCSSAVGSGREIGCDPQYGLDLLYSREFARIRNGRVGFEAGFSYTPLALRDNRSYSANVQRVEDAYPFRPGLNPPPATPADPYRGTFDGAGMVISDTPVRSIQNIPGGATVTGSRELDADLFALHLGPFLEMPIGQRCSLYLSGGLALGGVYSDFHWRERVTLAGTGSASSKGGGTAGDVLVGYYLGAMFNVALTQRATAFVGVQYQALGKYEHTEGGKKAVLDLNQSIFFSVGLGYAF